MSSLRTTVMTEMPPKQTTTWRELPLLWWTVIVTCTKLADAVLKQASAVVTAQPPPQTVTNQHHETKHCKTHQTRHIINLYPFKGIKQNQAYISHTSERITRSTLLTSILWSVLIFLTVHSPTTKISTPQLGKTSNSQNQQNTAIENFIAYSCFQLNKRQKCECGITREIKPLTEPTSRATSGCSVKLVKLIK